MGVTIQFESHRVELPFIYEAEHDSQLRYCGQDTLVTVRILKLMFRFANDPQSAATDEICE